MESIKKKVYMQIIYIEKVSFKMFVLLVVCKYMLKIEM